MIDRRSDSAADESLIDKRSSLDLYGINIISIKRCDEFENVHFW